MMRRSRATAAPRWFDAPRWFHAPRWLHAPRWFHVPFWLAALACGGCFWVQSTSVETESVEVDQPAAGGGPAGRGPAGPDRPDRAPGPGATPARPGVTEQLWLPVEPRLALLRSGMRIAAGRFDGTATAHVRITLAHAQPSIARAGLALLVAEMVADTPLDQGTRPSLRRAIENRGGRLELSADAWTTTFALTVPADDWRWLTRLAAEALGAVPTSQDRLETWRRDLAADLAARWSAEPLAKAVERVRAIELEGLPAWLDVVEDAALRDARTLHEQVYVPSRTTVVAAVPGMDADAAVAENARAFAPWLAQYPPDAPPTAPALLPPVNGLYWGATPGAPRAATTVAVPPAVAPDAAALGPVVGTVRCELRSDGPARFFELRGPLRAEDWSELRPAVAAARASLLRAPPGAEEVRTAAARARLRLLLDLGDGPSWSAEVTRAALAGAVPNLAIAPNGKPVARPGGTALFAPLLAGLDAPDRLDLRAVATAAAAEPGLVVVVGEGLSGRLEHGEMLGSTVSRARREAVAADAEQQEQAARAVLDRALAAVGGVPALLELSGYRATSVTRSGYGPETVDIEWFHRDGRYRRVRRLLASEIETVVGPDVAVETCAGRTRELAGPERRAVLDDASRHPLTLLAEYARGAAVYRQVSLREVHGRPLAVLERTDVEGARVRLSVDAGSGLVREVAHGVDLGNGVVYRREEWRDYRAAGHGLRAPHHRTTWIDDGSRGLVTVYRGVTAEAPDLELLRPGGPTR